MIQHQSLSMPVTKEFNFSFCSCSYSWLKIRVEKLDQTSPSLAALEIPMLIAVSFPFHNLGSAIRVKSLRWSRPEDKSYLQLICMIIIWPWDYQVPLPRLFCGPWRAPWWEHSILWFSHVEGPDYPVEKESLYKSAPSFPWCRSISHFITNMVSPLLPQHSFNNNVF